MIDGTVVRVHRHGQGAKGAGKQAIRRSLTEWSTKIIAMTDALDNLLRFTHIPGQHYDTVGVAPFSNQRISGGFLLTGRLMSTGSCMLSARKAPA
ncbi:hypothetical protein MSKU15_0726 [Komagataeibacter diospyri]|nr:hypothetical protein MSKU15_0726 [Komagataeibacter diospyri]